jgi:hypothetical protein
MQLKGVLSQQHFALPSDSQAEVRLGSQVYEFTSGPLSAHVQSHTPGDMWHRMTGVAYQGAAGLLTGSVWRQSALGADQLQCVTAGSGGCAGVRCAALCATSPDGLVAAHAPAICQQQTAVFV